MEQIYKAIPRRKPLQIYCERKKQKQQSAPATLPVLNQQRFTWTWTWSTLPGPGPAEVHLDMTKTSFHSYLIRLTQTSLLLEKVTWPWGRKIWILTTEAGTPLHVWMSATTLNHSGESLSHKDVNSTALFPNGPPDSPSNVVSRCGLNKHSDSFLKHPRTPFTKSQRSVSLHEKAVQVTTPNWHLHCTLQSALITNSPS